ncbi:unnamed protein product [Oikopleura dioica]|nr:unnamed protein product [Oikopleura dioica]CBY35238.1 unnamed protein product [Oikopleura dioica]
MFVCSSKKFSIFSTNLKFIGADLDSCELSRLKEN